MFFVTKDNIPHGVGFSTFGATHLLWLFGFLICAVISAYFYKKSTFKTRKIMRLTLGISIIVVEMLKNVVVAQLGEFSYGYLPFHLCGINILLVTFDLFKQSDTVRNFLYYFCIPGAMLALLFPNWTALPCMNFFNINSFLIHMLLVLYPLWLVAGEEVKPTIKTMPKSLALLVAIAIPIYFLNLAWGTNFMFLMDPESGNPLELFEKLLGSHLWGFPILLPVVMFILYLPILIKDKMKNKIK